MGKSVLAQALCFELRDDLPRQRLIHGRSLALELARLGREVVHDLDPEAEDEEAARRFRDKVEAEPGWLLLVDDVGDPRCQQVVDLLPGNAVILFTGKHPSGSWPPGMIDQSFEVAALTTDQSMELLSLDIRKLVRASLCTYGLYLSKAFGISSYVFSRSLILNPSFSL